LKEIEFLIDSDFNIIYTLPEFHFLTIQISCCSISLITTAMKTSFSSTLNGIFLFLFLFTLVYLTESCKKTNDYSPGISGTPGTNEIWMQSSQFNPVQKTVTVNTTVTWINKDSYAHTVTSDSTIFDSQNIGSGGTFSYTFTKKGTYKYHCKIHAMMTGSLVVQ
jgi:plastocyanin